MVLDELTNLFYGVFMTLLGHDPAVTYQSPPVRKSWPTAGQPDWKFGEDVLFMQPTWLDGQDVSQEIHDFWQDDGADDLIRHQEQTRVLQMRLVAYGPNCAEILYRLRTQIYNGVADLKKNHIFVVPGPEAPQYNPELFQARWWPRADMILRFNVGVAYDTAVKKIQSVDITLQANRPLDSEEVVTDGIFIVKE